MVEDSIDYYGGAFAHSWFSAKQADQFRPRSLELALLGVVVGVSRHRFVFDLRRSSSSDN